MAVIPNLWGQIRSHRSRYWVYALFWWLILWGAWAVRLWQLDASDLTFDEAATFVVANRPWLDILSYLRGAVREHPPVFYLLIRPWMQLAGTSEYSLRFFAASASLAGIALTARLVRVLARRSGIAEQSRLFVATGLPPLILALLPIEVYYARDARMYTLTIVWAALSSLLFLPLLLDQRRGEWPSPARLAGLVLVNGLAVFTHYYLVFLVFTQFVTFLALRRWRALLAWSGVHGLVGLMGLVWLARSPGLASSLSEAGGRFDPRWPTAGQLRRLLADLLFGPIRGVPWNLVYGCAVFVAMGLLVALLRSFRRRSPADGTSAAGAAARAIGPWLSISILLPVLLAFFMPEPPRSRFLIFVLPFAALALGQLPLIFADYRKTALVGLGLAILAISVLGVYGLPRTVRWIKSNYGHVIATVAAHSRPGDGVLFYGPWQEIQFKYYRPETFPPITPLPPYAPPLLNPEEAEPLLQELLNIYQRLWVVPAAVDDVDPGHFVAGWLNSNAHPVWTTPYLSLYEPPVDDKAFDVPAGFIFGDRLQLAFLETDARDVPAGESLRFTLKWAALDGLDGDVQLDFSLMDERGQRWLQWQNVPRRWDNPPSTWEAGAEIVDREGVIVPQGAPPGQYHVQMTVLSMDSGEPLQPSDVDRSYAEAHVELFSFKVVEPVSPPVLADVGDFAGPFVFRAPGETGATLTLGGFDLSGLRFTQGNPVGLQLNWLAPSEPLPELELRLQLVHRTRKVLTGSQATSMVTETLSLIPDYPVTQWSPKRLVSQPIVLNIPADATPGRADLILLVLDADARPWTIGDGEHLTLGTFTVEERPILQKLPSGLVPVQVDFADSKSGTGDQIGLRGYRVSGDAQPGGQLRLDYAWHALSHPRRIYSVFNHLFTLDGQPVGQIDGWPQGGVVLTTQWRPGEFISDRHVLEIPADAPPGPYILVVGLYDAASGDRLQAYVDGQPLPGDQWQLSIDGE